MKTDFTTLEELKAPSRRIKAKVSHLSENGTAQYTETDHLNSVSIERAGVNKFFGFGVCQTAEIILVDSNRELVINKGDIFKIAFSVGNVDRYIGDFAWFYANDISRDENTNEIKIKAQDRILDVATKKTVSELPLVFPATIADYATLAANALGLMLAYQTADEIFNLSFESGANYSGSETIRDLLDDIAEATQTIYYIYNDYLVFYKLENTEPVLTIGKEDYFTLTSKDAVMLANIGHTTELGDNITATSGIEGATQYIRGNGFLELREDTATILENAVSAISGLNINPVSCEWRGNYLLEIGDCLEFITKDNDSVYCFLLDEKLVYNGGLYSTIKWEFAGDEETESNPSTLGEALNQTFARVDKAAKSVEIVVSEVAENTNNISSLQLTTGSISADVAELDAAVSAAITADDISFEVKKELATNGVDKVITNTGFKFNDVGLTISKSGTEMETVITEDGMTVNKNGKEVLKADNVGVVAVNLHANTYLIVGKHSRFEDYGGNRTGCFWIG